MIYKISLIAAAAAAIAAVSLSGSFQNKAQQTELRLEESQKELAAAQAKEKKALDALNYVVDRYGDIDEKQYKELEKKLEDKKAELEATKAQYEEVNQKKNKELSEVRNRLFTLERDTLNLKNEIARLENDIRKLEKESTDKKNKPIAYTPELLSKIVAARMAFIKPEGLSMETLSKTFEGSIYALGGHMYTPLEEIRQDALDELNKYSPRAMKLISVGFEPQRSIIEMNVAYVYKAADNQGPYVTDKSGYMTIRLMLHNDRVISMSEDDTTPTKPTLTKGYKPFKYQGETSVISQ